MNQPTSRAPLSADPLPASGAWRPGDPIGDRRFAHLATDRAFVLEGGGALHDVEIAYETWGELDADGANAVLVCHALTGDSHAAGRAGPGHPTAGWWDALIGPGRPLDTDRWFVVCPNVLGGCQGSTGPASLDPATGAPYGSSFPVVTVRDMVRTQAALADQLGVTRWLSVIGGSMGGMQALEWGVMFPDRVASVVAIATTVAASAQQIALSSVQRSAIALDPAWRGGDYYDAGPGEGPHQGLAVARGMAQITYRTEGVYGERFGRKELDPLDDRYTLWQRFDVEGYLDYHGAKLVRRFDANSYLVINRAMDLHDIGRGRGGVESALARVRAPVMTMAIGSDALYPPYQQELICDTLGSIGRECVHVVIDSPDGHDAFLIETAQVGAALAPFLADVEKTR
ncbi:homoserine O-acetyltransferase MetX [Rhabdothermincola salaria]|uniref:homoserine O-acetyltransferase MetX n=1 Tax=Rhabdothermincola salaria TaxID=2903142 RepID=UPI001E2A43CA|nr:homoserine O-acetyltransferase [Rhabdothermincola salaria]MCD9622314.1 homoserine O-acetyltransferase [Rhabdothermincola salaria]